MEEKKTWQPKREKIASFLVSILAPRVGDASYTRRKLSSSAAAVMAPEGPSNRVNVLILNSSLAPSWVTIPQLPFLAPYTSHLIPHTFHLLSNSGAAQTLPLARLEQLHHPYSHTRRPQVVGSAVGYQGRSAYDFGHWLISRRCNPTSGKSVSETHPTSVEHLHQQATSLRS